MGALAIDDPMLALIARFAGCCEGLDVSEEAFLRQQLGEIRGYIERYPEGEKQERAMDWIARNAERYRRNWQKRAVAAQASTSRCPDCPLDPRPGGARCEIHKRWLDVLNLYMSGETSSRQYVETSLDLLRGHKERLRKSLTQVTSG